MIGWEKNAVRIPVTRELLIDAGLMGPLGTWDADAVRYREMWHRMSSHPFFPFRFWPPWERVDPPVLPVFRLGWGRWADWLDQRFCR